MAGTHSAFARLQTRAEPVPKAPSRLLEHPVAETVLQAISESRWDQAKSDNGTSPCIVDHIHRDHLTAECTNGY